MRAHAGTYAQVGFTYDASGSQAAADAGVPAAQGSGAGAAAAPYAPRLSMPLPEQLAGALPSSARELKVRTAIRSLTRSQSSRCRGGWFGVLAAPGS